MARSLLKLALDDFYTDGYYYTDYDIGGEGHAIIIDEKNKKKFLDDFAAEWRKKAEKALEKCEDWD